MATGDNIELEDIKEYHTNNRVHFVIKPNEFTKFSNLDIEKKLKMTGSIQLTNMVLFNHQGKLQKYATIKEILDEFFNLRISLYDNRKKYLISRLKRDLQILSNKARFILAVIDEEIKVKNVKKKDICKQLLAKNFTQMKDMPKILSTKPQFLDKKPKNAEEEGENENEEQQIEKEEDLYKEYSYLLNMSIWSLSFEKVEAMKKEVKSKEEELNVVEKTTLEMMWVNDLDQFLLMLDDVEAEEEKSRVDRPQVKGNAGTKRARPKKKVVEETKDNNESEIAKPKKKTAKPKKEEEKKTQSEKPSETKPKPVVKKQQQATISFPKKEEEKKSTTNTQLPLLERIAERIQASTSFQSAMENDTQGDKRKAPGALQGKPVARKKFVDLEDSSELTEGKNENFDNGNTDSIVVTFVFFMISGELKNF